MHIYRSTNGDISFLSHISTYMYIRMYVCGKALSVVFGPPWAGLYQHKIVFRPLRPPMSAAASPKIGASPNTFARNPPPTPTTKSPPHGTNMVSHPRALPPNTNKSTCRKSSLHTWAIGSIYRRDDGLSWHVRLTVMLLDIT